MGRPTVYGKEIKYFDNKFFGINLGYNFYAEHEGDISGVAGDMWFGIGDKLDGGMLANMVFMRSPYVLEYCEDMSTYQALRKLKKIQQNTERLAKPWKNYEPYKDNLVPADVPMVRREIIIDNTEIRHKYMSFQLPNGNYTLLQIYASHVDWNKRFGRKRKFTEEDLQYMQDYNSSGMNIGYMLRGGNSVQTGAAFGASWMKSKGTVQIIMPSISAYVIDDLVNTIKAGDCAISYGNEMLFKDGGLCLVNVRNINEYNFER